MKIEGMQCLDCNTVFWVEYGFSDMDIVCPYSSS